jgi:hypothetical protein
LPISDVAQRLGVYTAQDYALVIMEHLVAVYLRIDGPKNTA